jgi:beta-1,4-N-acetylglucosaminyltransferase
VAEDPHHAAKTDAAGRVAVLLVCTPGGHLLQLLSLRPAWGGFTHAWVTYDSSDARSLLADEAVYFAHGPGTRNLKNFVRNLPLAWRLVRDLKPTVILSTGAALAVPFAWIGRAFGAKIVYVESLTRIERVSLSCRLIAPVTDRLYVQWPELARRTRRARYAGNVFSIG